ncbi:DUF4132 domain-containing protein [Spirillospora sp. CA-253888]
MNDQLLSPADEDALVLPDSWRRQVQPRRGAGTPPAEVKVGASAARAARELMERARPHLAALTSKTALASKKPEMAEAARRYLAGGPDPLGAAVAATVAAASAAPAGPGHGLPTTAELNTFADAWIAEHGVPFAACALVEAVNVLPDRSRGEWSHAGPRVRSGVNENYQAGGALRRMRQLLATVDDAEHAAVEEALAGHRTNLFRRVVVAYLVPSRHDWVAEACAETTVQGNYHVARPLLLTSLGAPEHLDTPCAAGALGWGECTLTILATLLDSVGAAALPLLLATADDAYLEAAERRRVFEAVSLVPTDEALRALIDRRDDKHARPALLAAARRFPRRAVRLLGPAADDPAALQILTAVVRANPGVPLDGLPDKVRAALDTGPAVPDAVPEDLPALLVSPPWTRERKTVRPVVVTGLTPPADRRMVWAPGERDEWGSGDLSRWVEPFAPDTDWQAALKEFATARGSWLYRAAAMLLQGPEELFRPLMREWSGHEYWDEGDNLWAKALVARYEEDAYHLALKGAVANAGSCGVLLLPYRDAETAALMADALVRLKTARRTATAWFERHGPAAVPLLVPDAVGKKGRRRTAAEAALRLIADRAGTGEVVAAARAGYGAEAAEAVAAALAVDPLEILPAKLPEIDEWAAPSVLPQVLLRDRERALPAEATGHLVMMLALSKPGEPYGGVEIVRELCDPASLAAFGWALFREWDACGASAKENWAFTQLGLLGDDEAVRGLTPMIRAWPGDGGHAKAVTGLDVLAAIGTDVALMHLHGIAQKVKFKGLKARAQEKIEQIAAKLELTADQLADRLVPDFGLDADGGMVLDYGPRRFTVGFDEQLKPYVLDETGKLRKALPKPGAKDDEELATASYKRFAALKKDVRTSATAQIRRLESAMTAGRRWTPEEFRTYFVGHPLVWHIARRLVWLAWEGERGVPFRIAEDRTFADVDDDAFPLPEHAEIGIAHPLHLGDTAKAWAEVFADYEILQPFPQLGRPVHTLTGAERASGRLERFEGISVPVGRLLSLERYGWERAVPQDAGIEPWISKPLPGGLRLELSLNPGIIVGMVAEYAEQTIESAWLTDRLGLHWRGAEPRHTFAELDPVTVSEALADLATLTA